MPSATYRVSQATDEVLDNYEKYVAGGFAPFPLAMSRVKGHKAWDVDGKEYIDCLSMFCVVNTGHNHPRIVAAAQAAENEGALVNIAFHSPWYGLLAKRAHEVFGYDKFVSLTSGGEGLDAAVKTARKWGYLTKGIPEGKAYVLTVASCYHGATLSTVSLHSAKPKDFGPYMAQVGPVGPTSGKTIRYGVIDDLREVLEVDGENVAAFVVESIQGAAGVIVPPAGYLKQVADLCKKHNVLFVCDEIQTGLSRCGTLLAHQKEGVRPDLVVLGKGLAGGLYAMSAVIGDAPIMNLLSPREVGSTMSATPGACAAAIATLDVLIDEDLAARAVKLGKRFTDRLTSHNPPHFIDVQGSGLLLAIVLDLKPPKVTSSRIAALLMQRGVIVGAIPARGVLVHGRLRFAPPLTISEEDLLYVADVIARALVDIESIEEEIYGEQKM